MSPDFARYSVTTFDPGARLVFTHGLVNKPRSTAFFASKPAPKRTDGFDVLVQLVMAAMTTDPSATSCDAFSSITWILRGVAGGAAVAAAAPTAAIAPPSLTR